VLDATATDKRIADYKYKCESSLQMLATLDGSKIVRTFKASVAPPLAKVEKTLKHKSSKPGSEGNRFIGNDQL
jgi:hypothetical protein